MSLTEEERNAIVTYRIEKALVEKIVSLTEKNKITILRSEVCTIASYQRGFCPLRKELINDV